MSDPEETRKELERLHEAVVEAEVRYAQAAPHRRQKWIDEVRAAEWAFHERLCQVLGVDPGY